MNEIQLRLDELLFPSIADVAVLSVEVNIAIVRVDVAAGTHVRCPVAICVNGEDAIEWVVDEGGRGPFAADVLPAGRPRA